MSDPVIHNLVDAQFVEKYRHCLDHGWFQEDRTGVGTYATHAAVMRFDCQFGQMPIISLRGILPEKFQHEMHWFVSGNTNIKYLRDNKVGIWDSWFIKGTDKYDEPQIKTRTVQQRIDLSCTTLENTVAIEQFIERRIEISGIGGPHKLSMLDSRGSKQVTFGNLAHADLHEINKFLDQFGVAREYEFWEGVDGDVLTTQERIELALKAGKVYMVVPFLHGFHPGGGREPYEYLDFKHPNITTNFGFDRDQVDGFNHILDYSGIPRRRNLPKRLSLKRRLSRLSKNNEHGWSRVIGAIMMGEDDPAESKTVEVVVFRNGKFVDEKLNEGQVARVEQLLDFLGINAWPLLEADIGAGGYGAQWRKWQDLQLVSSASNAYPGYSEFVEQGYKKLATIQPEMATLGEHVMYREIDQLQNCIDKLRTNPDDRRIIVTAHNPGRTWQAALPPCHLYFQFTSQVLTMAQRVKLLKYKHRDDVELPQSGAGSVDGYLDKQGIPRRGLNCFVLLRSSDLPLGAVFNVAQYAYLLHMVAHVTKHAPMELVTVGVNAHIYLNQVDAIKELIWRDSDGDFDARMVIKGEFENIDDITFNDVEITGYTHGPFMDIPVAV
jgi:thymidylate synthase